MTRKDDTLDDTEFEDGAEVEFRDDLLLSTATDRRAIIKFANAAFCSVSGFDQDALIGVSHKIVRHPLMPRCIYHLIWHRLKSGLPVAAYFWNKAADGRSFWALGHIEPTPSGYLAVNIKPRSETFRMIKSLYADLMVEERKGQTREASIEGVLAALAGLGFADYDAFMMHALNAEFSDNPLSEKFRADFFARFQQLGDLLGQTETLVTDIGAGFNQVQAEPVNMRIIAGRLEGTGAALATISQNYETMAAEMHASVEKLRGENAGVLLRISELIKKGRFHAQLACLLEHAADLVEAPNDEWKLCLSDQAVRAMETGQKAISEVALASRAITDICRQVRRRINGLDVVKLLCRVESGRMNDSDAGLDGIISRLERFHGDTDGQLAQLSKYSNQFVSQHKPSDWANFRAS